MPQPKPSTTAPAGERVNPILVEATRGTLVESSHRGAIAVVDASGNVTLKVGDIDRPVYARSAIKPLQAIPLVESGAADAFKLGPEEIALACASHNGEPQQVERVRAWLKRVGLDQSDLECGRHLPYHEASLIALAKSGQDADQCHNNCSGKHAGFLTLARHKGWPTKGYIAYEHQVQQCILGILEIFCGFELGDAPRGIDGCGIPQLGIPLGHLALAMARLGDPQDMPDARALACLRVGRAMAAHPYLVAGSGRFCTRAMEAAKGRAWIKTGAEGVFCATLPEHKLGIALKIDDGAGRAAEVVMAGLLARFEVLGKTADGADLVTPPVTNRVGKQVGEIRLAEGAPL
ncbi:MAG: asparaginase [Kiloniellales bacterium]